MSGMGILLAFIVLVATWEIPRLAARGWRREMLAFSILTAVSLALNILILLGVQLPYLSTIITSLIKRALGG